MINTLRKDKLLQFAVIFVAAQVLLAIFAPFIGRDPIEQVTTRMKGPRWIICWEPTSWGVIFSRAFFLATGHP